MPVAPIKLLVQVSLGRVKALDKLTILDQMACGLAQPVSANLLADRQSDRIVVVRGCDLLVGAT